MIVRRSATTISSNDYHDIVGKPCTAKSEILGPENVAIAKIVTERASCPLIAEEDTKSLTKRSSTKRNFG